MGIRCADHVTPLYPQKLALTSPTGGGRSVGIVRSRTKATELIFYLLTPWSTVLHEKLTSKLCSCSRNSPHLWNPKVPHCIYDASRTNLEALTQYASSIHYNIQFNPTLESKDQINFLNLSIIRKTSQLTYSMEQSPS